MRKSENEWNSEEEMCEKWENEVLCAGNETGQYIVLLVLWKSCRNSATWKLRGNKKVTVALRRDFHVGNVDLSQRSYSLDQTINSFKKDSHVILNFLKKYVATWFSRHNLIFLKFEFPRFEISDTFSFNLEIYVAMCLTRRNIFIIFLKRPTIWYLI